MRTGDTHRSLRVLQQANRPGHRGRVAVGSHHDRCGEGAAVLGGDPGDTFGALIDHHAGDVGLLVQGGTLLHGPVGEQLVEVGALAHQPEGRELGQRRPGQFERFGPAAVDPQALVVQPAGLVGDVDPEAQQLLDRSGRQAVAAHLVAGERALLEQGHREALIGQPAGGRRRRRDLPRRRRRPLAPRTCRSSSSVLVRLLGIVSLRARTEQHRAIRARVRRSVSCKGDLCASGRLHHRCVPSPFPTLVRCRNT